MIIEDLPAADAASSPSRPAPRASASRVDARGCPVSTRAIAALEHAERAQWRMLSYVGDALADLDAAIAADPGWALPHIMKADLLLAGTEAGFAQMAAACLRDAEALAGGANERERAHLVAAGLCLAGRWDDACMAWERITVDQPQDVLAIGMAHAFDFFRGDTLHLQRRVGRVLPEWSKEAPLYGFVLGMHAFGLEENNLYAQAFDTGMQALAHDRRDAWAVHAVAHVHEMRGEHEAGGAFLAARSDDWAPDNGLAYHNWWHLALFHLERCEFASVLRLLDEKIVPGAATVLQKIDATAMLWRLRLAGIDVGERWAAAAAGWPVQGAEAGFYAFNDIHAALAQIGAGRIAEAFELVDALERRGAESTVPAAMAREVGTPMLRGLLAHATGRHADAVEILWRVRDAGGRYGGSHAQRDLVTQTLVDSAIQSGQRALARRLLHERALIKPATPFGERWLARLA